MNCQIIQQENYPKQIENITKKFKSLSLPFLYLEHVSQRRIENLELVVATKEINQSKTTKRDK